MVPVISSLSATMGVDLNTLAWTLSMGTDIGGSATPIGLRPMWRAPPLPPGRDTHQLGPLL